LQGGEALVELRWPR